MTPNSAAIGQDVGDQIQDGNYGSAAVRAEVAADGVERRHERPDDAVADRATGRGQTHLQLALVFGIDHSTAVTYASLTRQILTTASEPTASTPAIHG